MYWNFVILHHPRSQLCGSISLSKFGDDPILAVGDIAIYDFASLAKNAWPRPLSGAFRGLNPFKMWMVIKTLKGTSLDEDASFKP